MTISYPLELPMPEGVQPRNISLTLDYAQASSESPFTLEEQIYSYEAERWVLNIQFPPLKPEQAKAVRAFILALRGRIGTFKAGDPMNALPLGTPGLNAKVNGAGQTGYSLNVKDLIPSAAVAFAAGDDFELNGYLYTVVKDVASNGSGQATLDIMPSIRGTISDNQPLTVNSPKGHFRLENAKIGWASSYERTYDIALTALEAKP